jgi:hypothetical protein
MDVATCVEQVMKSDDIGAKGSKGMRRRSLCKTSSVNSDKEF